MIDQPETGVSIDQSTPVPPGRLSVNVRPVAASAPSFANSTVKPIWSPSKTPGSSAALAIVTCAPLGLVQLGNLKSPNRVRQLKLLLVE